jgi:hypothetical protein
VKYTCRKCGGAGHNARTCGRPSTYNNRVYVPKERAPRGTIPPPRIIPVTEPEIPIILEVAQDRAILARLRPLLVAAQIEGELDVDSLMLSCYLQGHQDRRIRV